MSEKQRVRIAASVAIAVDRLGTNPDHIVNAKPGDVLELFDDVAENLIAGNLATATDAPLTVTIPAEAYEPTYHQPRRTGNETTSRGAKAWPGDPGAKAARWSAGTTEE